MFLLCWEDKVIECWYKSVVTEVPVRFKLMMMLTLTIMVVIVRVMMLMKEGKREGR